MRTFRALASVGVLVAAGLGVAAPAHADEASDRSGTQRLYVNGRLLATGSFNSRGEIFRATDNRIDGRSAVIQYSLRGGPIRTCINSRGAGTTRTCNKSFREGSRVVWRICAIDRETGRGFCSPVWMDDRARATG